MRNRTFQFTDGSKATLVFNELKIVIVDDPDKGQFEISGFVDDAHMNEFFNCGDFEDREDNEYYVRYGNEDKLIWRYF